MAIFRILELLKGFASLPTSYRPTPADFRRPPPTTQLACSTALKSIVIVWRVTHSTHSTHTAQGCILAPTRTSEFGAVRSLRAQVLPVLAYMTRYRKRRRRSPAALSVSRMCFVTLCPLHCPLYAKCDKAALDCEGAGRGKLRVVVTLCYDGVAAPGFAQSHIRNVHRRNVLIARMGSHGVGGRKRKKVLQPQGKARPTSVVKGLRFSL
jgi:hypothetical protein